MGWGMPDAQCLGAERASCGDRLMTSLMIVDVRDKQDRGGSWAQCIPPGRCYALKRKTFVKVGALGGQEGAGC